MVFAGLLMNWAPNASEQVSSARLSGCLLPFLLPPHLSVCLRVNGEQKVALEMGKGLNFSANLLLNSTISPLR